MLIVVAYDVSTETKEGRRRLRRVAQACKDYGQRVQKSVFECLVRDADWAKLRHRLLTDFCQRKIASASIFWMKTREREPNITALENQLTLMVFW
jgi:CRISPR-associated endonuclease Cas2